jgi:imidazolonepropionase-like amidohydrolase
VTVNRPPTKVTCKNGPVTARRIKSFGVSIGSGRTSSDVYIGSDAVLFKDVTVFDGERFMDHPIDVATLFGAIAMVGEGLSLAGTGEVERVEGGYLFPGFVDAHVHLSMSEPHTVAAGGVTGVLDLGSPLAYAFAEHPPLRFAAAGPLITARRGYPTTSWGANGYGLEVGDPGQARDAVALLADSGAAIVKVAIEPGGGPTLDARTLRAVVEAAHGRRLKVAAHALSVDAVREALTVGVDVLAHTPMEQLPEDLIGSLGANGVTVISTLRAFGAHDSTRANLAALAAAGCPIAYGTDLGNGSIRPGIDAAELELLEHALGDRARALAAATSVAGALAGAGGRIAPEMPADLLWVPRFDSFDDLVRDARIWIGER